MSGQRRKTAVVVCPGRGTYNAAELGYLARYHRARGDFLDVVDAHRLANRQTPVTALDSAPTFLSDHTTSENASTLIFACSFADFSAIDFDAYEIVAITGNSMGWYTALVCGGAVSVADGLEIVSTMGALMHDRGVGGQIVYPIVEDDWRPSAQRRAGVMARIARAVGMGARLYVSIDLGGMLVLAGDDPALAALADELPTVGRYPMRLAKHAAFHTPLLSHISSEARRKLPPALFAGPALPLVDGRGIIWRPFASAPESLWDYTLGAQVTETYDFAAAVRVSVREFAPDVLIVLGPGDTLGGSVAQSLIASDWRGLADRSDFSRRQAAAPILLAMGRPEQRALVTDQRGQFEIH
jgi:[acyl-carrier-protein] S-malonyltransferase